MPSTFTVCIVVVVLLAAVSAYPKSTYDSQYWYDDDDAGGDSAPPPYSRKLRLSGDVFSRLESINNMIHSAQQFGCRMDGEECSWEPSDSLRCCHHHNCRCNIVGNCKCELSIGKK